MNRVIADRATQRVLLGARWSLPGFLPGAGTGGWRRDSTQLLRVSTSRAPLLAPRAAAEFVPRRSSTTATRGDSLNFGCPHPSFPRKLGFLILVFFFLPGVMFLQGRGDLVARGMPLGLRWQSSSAPSTNCWSCLQFWSCQDF